MPLIDTLKQLQGDLADREFANKLGIHRVSWVRIKNGRVPVSDKFLIRVHKAFPEVDIFPQPDVTASDLVVTEKNYNAPQTAQGGKRRGFGRWLKALYLRVFPSDRDKPTKSKSRGG